MANLCQSQSDIGASATKIWRGPAVAQNQDGLNRRQAMAAGATAAALSASPTFAVATKNWSAGSVVHLLPAVNHNSVLLKTSFNTAYKTVHLLVDGRAVTGSKTDMDGRYWHFHVTDLPANTRLTLQLASGRTKLCDPWPLNTMPKPDEAVGNFRFLSFTCAGGDPALPGMSGESFRPMDVRHRLLARAMSFGPQAVIANGDHVYWDQTTWLNSRNPRIKAAASAWYGKFGNLDRSLPALGSANEDVLRRVGENQIAAVYGTQLRSTPSYFVADDHDYFENDEAEERFVTFPPDQFSMSAKRAIQNLFYPEFLPDAARPIGLSGALSDGLDGSFGTLRVGKLFEALIYDCGGYITLKGPSARLVPIEAENWLLDRTRRQDTAQLLHVPSHPPGWSAGKWREWYPDIMESPATRIATDGTAITDWGGSSDGKGKLSTAHPKYFWQSGWHAQHQRIFSALSQQEKRPAAIMSGDLHATGALRIERSGDLDLSANPVNMLLAGTLGTSDSGWPSGARGAAPQVPASLLAKVTDPLVERNGFTIVDVTPEKMIFRLFGWREPLPISAIDTLEPHAVITVARPV